MNGMNGNDTYGATPLKLEAFDTIESITGVITDITSKGFDKGPRWVITVDDDWTLIVNDTNYRAVKKVYGARSGDWLHKPVTAYKGKLYARGEEREGICLRIPQEDLLSPQPKESLDAANAELSELGDAANKDALTDDIPYSP